MVHVRDRVSHVICQSKFLNEAGWRFQRGGVRGGRLNVSLGTEQIYGESGLTSFTIESRGMIGH